MRGGAVRSDLHNNQSGSGRDAAVLRFIHPTAGSDSGRGRAVADGIAGGETGSAGQGGINLRPGVDRSSALEVTGLTGPAVVGKIVDILDAGLALRVPEVGILPVNAPIQNGHHDVAAAHIVLSHRGVEPDFRSNLVQRHHWPTGGQQHPEPESPSDHSRTLRTAPVSRKPRVGRA